MENFDIKIDWSAAVSDAQPCGNNCEYDNQFAELEIASAPTSEQQYGDTVIAGKPPDWRRVLELAVELSQKTRDLRILLLMTRALTRLHGLPGLQYGLHAVARVSQAHWDDLYPQLLEDGERDPHMRFGAICNFADANGLMSDIRHSDVLTTPLGTLTFRDMERIHESGSVDINGINISRDQLHRIIGDMESAGRPPVTELPTHITQTLREIQEKYTADLGDDLSPNFTGLLSAFGVIISLMKTPHSEPAPSAQETAQASPSAPLPGMPSARSAGTGIAGIHSRKDAIHQLEAVCRYLEVNEPTNPVQLMVRRSIEFMEMNFMELMQHIAPDGLAQASFITGVPATPHE